VPMNCPKCSCPRHRAAVTNSKPADQTVRRRVCLDCGHAWFTAEAEVSRYAVGWCSGHASKPVLRVPVTLTLSHVEVGQVGPKPRQCEELSQPG
jgi:hypothetical protein